MIVPVVLGFYVLVCISVVFFNCWKVLSEKRIRWRTEHWKVRDRLWFWCDAVRYAALSPQEQEKMAAKRARRLRSNGRVLAFHAAMEEVRAADAEALEESMPLLAQIVRRLYSRYKGRSARKQAYYSFLVTHFQTMKYAPSEQITDYLLEQIQTAKSLYNLENALRAIYSAGQVRLVLEALEALENVEEIFLHEKLLIEGLLTFEDRNALISAIWARFSEYDSEMQELLLDYIRFASGAWGEEMLALLEKAEGLEVKIACLRYFGKYPEARFRAPLYRLTRESGDAEWELCAVCMTVLASYPGEETLRLLKNGLCSRNWYVRYNAALSLRALKVDAEQVQDILTGDDRYAREMLQYRLGIPTQTREEAVTV